MKTCTVCLVEKPGSEFSHHPNGKGKLQSWCKACRAAWVRNRRNSPGGRDRERKTVRARGRTLEALARLHPGEFELLLGRERVIEGLPAIPWTREEAS